MLSIFRLKPCVRSRSGQRSQWNVFTFWALGSVRRAAKRSLSPEVLDRWPERILLKLKGTWKGQGQGQVTKGHYKIKFTDMPCGTCFLGHFARRYRWWQWFDHMTSSDKTFDGGQVKVRSNKVKILNPYSYVESTCFLLSISSGFHTCN